MSSEHSAESDAPREHVLKVAPEYWPALVDGSKTFEVRRNDRAFQKGDVLVLYPTHDQRGSEYCRPTCSDTYCSRKPPTERRTVTFVYSGDPRFGGHGGIQPGHVVLGMARIATCSDCGHDERLHYALGHTGCHDLTCSCTRVTPPGGDR